MTSAELCRWLGPTIPTSLAFYPLRRVPMPSSFADLPHSGAGSGRRWRVVPAGAAPITSALSSTCCRPCWGESGEMITTPASSPPGAASVRHKQSSARVACSSGQNHGRPFPADRPPRSSVVTDLRWRGPVSPGRGPGHVSPARRLPTAANQHRTTVVACQKATAIWLSALS